MASTTTPASNPHHVRSISLPSRSHPLSVRVEEGLHKLNTWATSSLLQASSPTAELLCVGLQALEEMYDCVEEVLRLPQTQQAIAKHQREEWAAEELDSSVSLLDLCQTTRDAISSIKEQAQGLQSALRTRRLDGGYSTLDGKIHAFANARKKAHKGSSKHMKALKQVEASRHVLPLSAADDDLPLALRALRDVRVISIVIFRSISASLVSKPTTRWFRSSRRSSEVEQSSSELEEAEASLRSIRGKHCSEKEAGFEKKVDETQRRLQRLEAGMGSLETALESMFRRLIQNRVSLLNILNLQ